MEKKEGENTFSSMKIWLWQGNTSWLCSYFSLVVKGKVGRPINAGFQQRAIRNNRKASQ